MDNFADILGKLLLISFLVFIIVSILNGMEYYRLSKPEIQIEYKPIYKDRIVEKPCRWEDMPAINY